MKRLNHEPVADAARINQASVHHFNSLTNLSHTVKPTSEISLQWHLENVHWFKLGLRNSFGIDFRSATCRFESSDGKTRSVLFNYLSEVLPLVAGRASQLSPLGQRMYSRFADSAVESFWEIYYRFQPLLRHYADRFEVSVDELGNSLGRAILLYEPERGTKFYSYLNRTLQQSVKTLRGRIWSEQFQIPSSAGRLMTKIMWLVDQESLAQKRRLSLEEAESVVIQFLSSHRYEFAELTMRKVARVAIERRKQLSLDAMLDDAVEPTQRAYWGLLSGGQSVESKSGADFIDSQDEYEYAIRRVVAAIENANLNARDAALVLEHLQLPHDEAILAKNEASMTPGGLRNRRSQVIVRFFASFHADRARRFKRFIHAEARECRPVLLREIEGLSDQFGISTESTVKLVLNSMALSKLPYRITLTQREQLSRYLAAFKTKEPRNVVPRLSVQAFNKLTACLIDQERQGFPCLRTD